MKTRQTLLSIFELIFTFVGANFINFCLAIFYICGRFVFTIVGVFTLVGELFLHLW